MNSNNSRLLIVLFVGLLIVGGIVYLGNRPTPSVPVGDSNTTQVPSATNQEAETTVAQEEQYQDYSESAFIAAGEEGKRRVLFFHAPWCPTCIPANKDFLENASSLPDDVVVFKTDYDTSAELKNKYGVTYQHTYVQVDENGEKINIWNGGAVDELIENLL